MSYLHSFLASKNHEDFLIQGLRFSIALIFIWFGLLKVAGYNPVSELIQYSLMPSFASGTGLFVLGMLEVSIGVLILTNRFLVFTYGILLLHLVGTFSTFIFGWQVIFEPQFPILSIGGEFVVKNIILILAGLVVLVHEERRARAK